jgi:hypothetical protein
MHPSSARHLLTAARFFPEVMSNALARCVIVLGSAATLAGCSRGFTATPEERVGFLRELVRARTVSRETAPIDACSVNRFMQGVPAWRDSLVAAELGMIATDTLPCSDDAAPRPGRFVLTQWYRNWSGEYVIRGAEYPWDQGYRFTDGVYVGREQSADQKELARLAARRAASPADSGDSSRLRGDSTRSAGTVSDSLVDTTRDSIASRSR